MNIIYDGLTKGFFNTVKRKGGSYTLTCKKGVDMVVIHNIMKIKTIGVFLLYYIITNETKR